MDQPTPLVNGDDVTRVVRRDFGSDSLDEILALLNTYGEETYHSEQDRVRLAALKLANGNRERLKREIRSATYDYRDILLAAEYPECGKKLLRLDKLSDEEKKRIYDADWKQYTDWLNR